MTKPCVRHPAATSSLCRLRSGPGLAAVLCAAALGLIACTYRPGADNPVAQSLTWFSYAAANDIRRDCASGTADRVRLIYNGRYDEQIRTYDINAIDDGAMIEVRVRGPAGNLTRGVELMEPFGPWRAEARLVRVSEPEMETLRMALIDNGLAQPPLSPLRLNSGEFYWLVSACLRGRFVVNAWKYPSPRFAALQFPAILLSHDPTGIDLNRPRPTNQYSESESDRFGDDEFQFLLHGTRLTTGGALLGG